MIETFSLSFQQRERLRKDFPDTEFKDEEYLLELMANNEDKDVSDEDAIMNALCNHTTRTKLNSINKENQETSHENGEETSNKEQED